MTFFMVELTVADFVRSVAWYRDVLGLTVTKLDEPNGFALLTDHPPPANSAGIDDLPRKGGGEEGGGDLGSVTRRSPALFASPLAGEVDPSREATGAGGGWNDNNLSPRLALKRGTPSPTSVRLHFHIPDLTAELARLAALGVHPEAAPKTSDEGYRRAVLRDPDGYPVTLFEWVESA